MSPFDPPPISPSAYVAALFRHGDRTREPRRDDRGRLVSDLTISPNPEVVREARRRTAEAN